MCHFITATLPQSAKLDSVALLFEAHKLSFKQISNPHILLQLESADTYILTTASHCDCGTALGMLNRSGEPEHVDHGNEIKKFRKQGWSEPKIQRWLEQKQQTKEKYLREDDARAETGTPDAARWVEFITDVLKSGYTRRIGLLLHLYHGGIASERIKILGKEKVKLKELSAKSLMEMKEDVVYEFVV